MSVIKNIVSFDKDDWNHIWFLIKEMAKAFIKMDYDNFLMAKALISLHCRFKSTIVKK